MFDECFEERDFLDSPEFDNADDHADDNDGVENTTELVLSSEEYSFDFTETTTDRDSSDEGSSDNEDDDDEENSGKSTTVVPLVILYDRR